MNQRAILTIFERVGAIITDSHIIYTSGRHGTSYVNKDALYVHPAETGVICSYIAAQFVDASVEVVAGPTIGGVILAQWTAYHLRKMTRSPVLAVYAEEDAETRRRVFRRGYGEIVAGKRVLVVEDVLTTGGSVRKVVDAVRELGGIPVGIGALCNRGGLTAEALDVPHFAPLLTLSLESWDERECPLCQQGVPVNTQVGKGAQRRGIG